MILYNTLCLSDPLPCNQHVQHRNLLDVIDCFLVGDHCKVITIQLENLVMYPKPSFASSTVGRYICYIYSIVLITLQHGISHKVRSGF